MTGPEANGGAGDPTPPPPVPDSRDIASVYHADRFETAEEFASRGNERVNHSRDAVNEEMISLFEHKEAAFPGLSDAEYTAKTLHELTADWRSKHPSPGRQDFYENIEKEVEEKAVSHFVSRFIDSRIKPENEALSDTIKEVFSPEDRIQIFQKVQYQIYRKIYDHASPILEQPTDGEWFGQWKAYFEANPDQVKQLKWEHGADQGKIELCNEILELRRGERHSSEHVASRLVDCRISPNQFDSHSLVRELKLVLGDRWNDVEHEYLKEFAGHKPEDITIRPDPGDVLTNPMSHPYSLEDAFLLSWVNDTRVEALRNPPAPSSPNLAPAPTTPETAPQRASRFWKIIDSTATLFKPYLKSAWDRTRKLNKSDLILGKGLDVGMAAILGAAVRGLITSNNKYGPMLGAGAGALFGASHTFNRDSSNRYNKALQRKSTAGDSSATSELAGLNKENIIKKELITKRKEAWNRFRKLSKQDQTIVIGWTAFGGGVGAVVGAAGYELGESLMQQDPAAIEYVFRGIIDQLVPPIQH